MSNEYTGWKLFDKITIVAKKQREWDPEKCEHVFTDNYQGYIVDPNNKQQLKTARDWGTDYVWRDYTDALGNRQENKEIIEPEEYTYDNKNFTLELWQSANSSTQGGKLSFWNCWITASDGRRFLVGIASDLLLDVLKSTTMINGVVQEPLMFARCEGGVGMLSENMNSYKDALADEAARVDKSKGKTSKHKVGYVYETLTRKDIYFGDVYQWYEPVYETKPQNHFPYGTCEQLVGFRKLDKPKQLKWFTTYYEDKTAEYYKKHFVGYELEGKLPARKEGIKIPDNMMPDLSECIDELNIKQAKHLEELERVRSKGLYMSNWIDTRDIGLSTSATEYTLPTVQKQLITSLGYTILD